MVNLRYLGFKDWSRYVLGQKMFGSQLQSKTEVLQGLNYHFLLELKLNIHTQKKRDQLWNQTPQN